MRYINLNEELNAMDAHVMASTLEHTLRRSSWRNYKNRPVLNIAAVAAFVEDLTEVADKLTREELYTLEHAAYELHDFEAYQAARVRLYGYEDPYVVYEWEEWR